MNKTTYDPEKFNLSTAKIKKEGNSYEIVIEPDPAIAFKEGKDIAILDILHSEQIFADAQRGQLAPEATFQKAFGTKNVIEIAKIILTDGAVHITAEHRKRQIEKKRRQIVTHIQKRGIDPRTKAPHTPARIELAMEEAKVHVDEFKAVEIQVKDIVKKLQPILPISFETKKVHVLVDAKHAHSLFGYIQSTGTITQNSWNNDGSWSGVVEIPGGIEQDFYDTLNSRTQGTVQTEIVEK
jgi:ribosome maturation protein SDO1